MRIFLANLTRCHASRVSKLFCAFPYDGRALCLFLHSLQLLHPPNSSHDYSPTRHVAGSQHISGPRSRPPHVPASIITTVQTRPPMTTVLNPLCPFAPAFACSPSHTTAYCASTVSTVRHPNTSRLRYNMFWVKRRNTPTERRLSTAAILALLRLYLFGDSLKFRPTPVVNIVAPNDRRAAPNIAATAFTLQAPEPNTHGPAPHPTSNTPHAPSHHLPPESTLPFFSDYDLRH